jgi:hypothetical protein
MSEMERERRARSAEDEIDETLEPGGETAEPEQAAQQDFAARTSMMSNAMPVGSSPVAGAVIGSGGEMGMDPTTDEEEVEDERAARQPPSEEAR